MKKIISLLLSVMMICGMFATLPVMAAESNLITNAADAVTFKSYVVDNELVFDENYFFMGEFSKDSSVSDGTIAIKLTSSANVKAAVGVYWEEHKTAMGIPVYNYETFETEALTTVELEAGEAKIIPLHSYYCYSKFVPAYFGLTLQNSEKLSEDVTIKAELIYVTVDETEHDEDGEYWVDVTVTEGDSIAYLEHAFEGPVTFNNSELEKMGKVLTSVKFGASVNYDEIVEAFAAITSDDAKKELNGNLTEEQMKALADAIASGNSGKEVSTNSGVVTLPYVALAQAPAVDGTSYAVKAEKVEATEVAPTGKDAVVAYDITIKADDSEVANPVVAQKVVIDLPNGWNKTGVQYKHGSDDWADATVENGKVIFYADSFSVFTLAGTKVAADETASDNKADKVKFNLVQDDVNKNKFSVVIAPTDETKQIFKFATAAMEVQFRNDGITEDAMETFTYELKAAEGISITNLEDVSIADDAVIGGFTFVATAEDGNLITAPVGEAIVIAEIEITGKGKFKVMSDSAEVENVIYTETLDDNEAVAVSVMANNWSNVFEIPEQKYELTINVDFGLNKIETDDADYLGMTVTLVGSISKEEKVLNIGEELAVTLSADTATATGKIELPAKENYEFVIKGLGYRTFRGNVYLDENKTINLWNNAKTSGSVNVIADDDTTAKDVTFLVGDIYMDGIVDIYDLSAATSYYGAENIDKANTNVYACDLNRDGKITIADIAYVQVSYGN